MELCIYIYVCIGWYTNTFFWFSQLRGPRRKDTLVSRGTLFFSNIILILISSNKNDNIILIKIPELFGKLVNSRTGAGDI